MADNISVTVTSTPTKLYTSAGPQQETILVDNAGAATITIGGKNVVAGEGPQLAQSATAAPLTLTEDTLYAVCPAGQTATVYIAHWISGPTI